MRRPSLTRLTVSALEVTLLYLHRLILAGSTPEADRAELRRACRFLEDLVAYQRSAPPKGKPKDDRN